MTKTIIDLEEHIKYNVNELDILELLNITSEDLVERFRDEIEDNYEYLIQELELGEDEEFDN